MSEFLEGVDKLIIFCVVIGFLNSIAATYCCSAMVFVRFVSHEVDFAEEPVVIGDRLKLCHLSVLGEDDYFCSWCLSLRTILYLFL